MNQRDDPSPDGGDQQRGRRERSRPVAAAHLVQGLWCAWAAVDGRPSVGQLRRAWIGAGHLGTDGGLARAGRGGRRGLLDGRGSRARRFIGLIAAGMAVGTLGDFFNAGLLDRVVPLPDPVLGGMIWFGWATSPTSGPASKRRVWPTCVIDCARKISLNAWLLVAVIGWYVIVYSSPDEKTHPWYLPAAVLDAVGIDSRLRHRTGLAESIIPLDGRRRGLFFVSDMLLAIALFRGAVLNATTLVWLTYSPGQMLIVFGALAVCPLLVGHGAAPEFAIPAAGARK